MKYRIITNGNNFKVQTRFLLIFWTTIQRPEDLDNKDFGGPRTFETLDEAKKFIEALNKPKYKQGISMKQSDINNQMLVILSLLVESEVGESIRKHGDYTKRIKEMQSKLKELRNDIETQMEQEESWEIRSF